MSVEFNAFYHAQEAHEYQKYGDEDYMFHLENVSDMVCELGHDYKWEGYIFKDALDVAWLHDCLEDQPEYYNSIPNVPEHIHEAIVAISKQDDETRSEYLDRCCENRLAHFIKICDTMSNLKCSVESIDSRRVNKYTKQLAKLIEVWEDKYE